MLVGLLAALSLLRGWWELGRTVSLSPLETAKAFAAPILEYGGSHEAVGVLKEVGATQMHYEGGRIMDSGGHQALLVGGSDVEGAGRRRHKA
jgi:hypothetical protein